MKKIFHLAAVAVLAIGAASCTKDANDNPGNIPAGTGNKFTFVLPPQSGAITYAGEVAASANEKKLDLTKTSIFMFDASNTLEAVIEGSANITAGTNPAGKPTATIEVDDAWTGNKTFFIVGNTDQDAAANLPAAAAIGTMTSAQFFELVTVAQSGQLSSANGLLLAGTVSVTNIEQTPSSNVDMYRAVARFDIDQNVTLNKVLIKRIDVVNANLNGYITAYGRGVKATGLIKGDIDNIAVSQTTTVVDINNTPADATDDHNFQKQEAVFYMYPTNLKAANANGTEIFLTGEVNGVETIYTLNKEDSDLVTDCEIKANTRYIISAIDNLTHTFTITIADWDEGDALVGRPGGSSAFGIVTPAAGDITNGTFNPTYNSIAVTDPTAAFSATFSVKGSSTKGVMAQVLAQTGTGLEDYSSHFTASTPVYDGSGVTYAAPYFNYTFTVSSVGTPEAKNFTTIIRLTDKASGATSDITVYYTGNTDPIIGEDEKEIVMYPTEVGLLPAVKVKGTINIAGVGMTEISAVFAPVNVGAIKTDATVINVLSCGYIYQWGRMYTSFTESSDQIIPTDTYQGPISYSDGIAGGAYENYFITGAPTTPFDWTTDPEGTALWSGVNSQGPCPIGWRLPTRDEMTILANNYSAGKGSFNSVNHSIDFVGENGILSLPCAGLRGAGSGKSWYQATQAYYWASTTISTNADFLRINPAGSEKAVYNGPKANGYSVRCVKDVN